MSERVPIMRLGETLLLTLQGDFDDTSILRLENDISSEVVDKRTTGVLIDMSGLLIVDTFIARVISRIVGMVQLLGSDAALVGIQPAVAITLVELGVPMGSIHTALDAETGLSLLRGLRRDAAGTR
jgi:rsbT antagonist protein RsbS